MFQAISQVFRSYSYTVEPAVEEQSTSIGSEKQQRQQQQQQQQQAKKQRESKPTGTWCFCLKGCVTSSGMVPSA